MAKDETNIGAILSYAIIILTVLIGLLYTPFMLRMLGKSEYGLYMLIGSVVGYMSVLDFGLQNTVYRFTAKYRAESDVQGQENFLAHVFIMYAGITALVLAVGTMVYFNLNLLFSNSLTDSEFYKAKIMFAILVINLAVTLPIGAFEYVIKGYGKFIFANSVSILRIILRTVALVSVLSLGYKSIAIVLVDTTFNIGIGIVYAIYCFSKLGIRIKLYRFVKSELYEILSYSIFVFILAMVNQFFWKIGQVVLGIRIGTGPVAVYSLAITLVLYYQQISLALSSVLVPKVTYMIKDQISNSDLTDFMIKVGRIQLILLGLILSEFIVNGREFIYLWVGPQYENVYTIALIIFLPLTVPMIQTLAGVILKVKNMQSFKAKAYILMSLVNFILAFALAKRFGSIGVGLLTGISVFVFQIIIMNIYYSKILKLEIKRFFIETLSGIIWAIGISTAAGIAIGNLPIENWLGLAIKIVLMGIVYIIAVFIIGLNKFEKKIVLSYMPKFK